LLSATRSDKNQKKEICIFDFIPKKISNFAA